MTPTEFKETRLRLGMTQVELAKAIKCTQQNVSQIEAGKIAISERTVRLLELLTHNQDAQTN